MNRKLKDLLENIGWYCYEYEDGKYVDIRKVSPAGEDFGFSVEIENFVENVIDYAENFDADEHCKMWVENMHNVSGVPQSIRTLLEDADAIKEMLLELAKEVKFIKNERINFDSKYNKNI